MRLKTKTLILILLSLGSISTVATSNPLAHATVPPARLEIWSPDIGGPNGSNMTSLTLFPVGKQFTVLVNVTGTGPIGGFDISLNYNLTLGPNVLQWVHPTNVLDPLRAGLIDPFNIPSYCPSITRVILASPSTEFPPGNIRYAPLFQGSCTVNGTGILMTLVFKVTGVGAGSIDIVTATGNGRSGSTIEGLGPNGPTTVPFTPYSAYFKNKPGIPPVPTFSFSPQLPLIRQLVTFNATQSYDPEHATAPNHGISPESVVYDSDNNNTYNGEPLILGSTPPAGSVLAKDRNILYVDSDHNNKWDPGETVVDDTGGTLTFTLGDVLIAGAAPPLGIHLAYDPKISFVDTHANGIWDNGYVWDFGDGTPLISGNVTYHVFVSTGSIPAAGTYPVKLVVYDADNNLPMRRVVPITVPSNPMNDIAVGLAFRNPQPTQGDTLQIQVAIANEGTLDEHTNLNVTYDFKGSTIIAREVGLVLPPGELRIFNYNLSTSFLVPGTYTVTAQAVIVNATTGAIVPDPSPSDNTASESFVLLAPPPADGHASLVKWKSLPEFHHEVLSRKPIQTLLAAAVNDGNQTIDSYVQFHVTSDAGVGFSIFTPTVTLSPGQTIDSRLDTSFTASFRPIPGIYTVTATVYYNAIAGSFKFTPDISSQKSYSFIASWAMR